MLSVGFVSCDPPDHTKRPNGRRMKVRLLHRRRYSSHQHEAVLVSLTRTCHEAFAIQQISTEKKKKKKHAHVAVHCRVDTSIGGRGRRGERSPRRARRYRGARPLLLLVLFA